MTRPAPPPVHPHPPRKRVDLSQRARWGRAPTRDAPTPDRPTPTSTPRDLTVALDSRRCGNDGGEVPASAGTTEMARRQILGVCPSGRRRTYEHLDRDRQSRPPRAAPAAISAALKIALVSPYDFGTPGRRERPREQPRPRAAREGALGHRHRPARELEGAQARAGVHPDGEACSRSERRRGRPYHVLRLAGAERPQVAAPGAVRHRPPPRADDAGAAVRVPAQLDVRERRARSTRSTAPASTGRGGT